MTVVPYNSSYQKKIVESIVQSAVVGKKICCMITSQNLAKEVQKQLVAKDIVTKLYHGDNQDVDEDNVTMAETKKNELSDVNTYWKQCQVLIYTSTVTAGVSFD